jgi:ABC-2 type transport system permease protein
VLLLAQQAVIVAGVSGLAVGGADLGAPAGTRSLLSHAGVASAILTLVFGILAVAGEYRHRTITDTYLATPARGRVLAAKLTSHALVGLAVGILSAGTGLLVTWAWTAGEGATLDLTGGELGRMLAGIVAVNVAYAAIGVSLGALIRNVTAAVSAALVWITLVETTVANLVGDLGRWLPNRAGMALDAMPATEILLPQWGGGLLLAGYAVAFALVAAATTVRRDVT